MKYKFLFVSNSALITDIAWKVYEEGHDVKLYIKDNHFKDTGDGFVPKIASWKSETDWADTIVFDDNVGHGKYAKNLRKLGKHVIGGTPYTERLEEDRSFGQEELQKVGVKILTQKQFTNFDNAIKYIQSNPDQYVFKPRGEGYSIRRLLFVSNTKNGSDTIQTLRTYKKLYSKKIKVFQLQKYVQGIEVGVSAFFNGHKFITPINIAFEHKRLFPGNIGPLTGEMGTSMFWSNPNKLFRETLEKMQPILETQNYVGYIDLNCIVNKNGIYPLEFTCRFGYPTISIQHEGIRDNFGSFLYNLSLQKDFTIKVKQGVQIGVRIVMPPYPYINSKIFSIFSKDVPILLKNKSLDGIHIEDVKKINNEWIVTGGIGSTLIVTGSGSNIYEAQKQTYTRIKNIAIPNMYYRNDIGNLWEEEIKLLKEWKYINN